jgi:WD40 repeat protein
MMKKQLFFRKLIFFGLSLVLLCSCTGFLDVRMGTLSLNFHIDAGIPGAGVSKTVNGEADSHAKSLEPMDSWAPVRYSIAGTGPQGETFSISSLTQSIETKLAPGDWSIEVKAYSESNIEVGKGTTTCNLLPSKRVTGHITLYPIRGTGSIELVIHNSLQTQTGSRVVGTLEYRGIAGPQGFPAQETLIIDIPVDQSIVSFSNVQAGHYLLNVRHIDTEGTAVGGTVDTILVVAGYLTGGTCVLVMGDPQLGLSTIVHQYSTLPLPIMSAPHIASFDHLPRPSAISTYGAVAGEEVARHWYNNGILLGDALPIADTQGVLGHTSFTSPSIPDMEGISVAKLDFIEESLGDVRSGAGGLIYYLNTGNNSGSFAWLASYDYRSAMCPPLHVNGSFLNSDGCGVSYPAKFVAGSPSGMIAIAGLDEEGALHVFHSPYEAAAMTESGNEAMPLETSWVRLWRDKLKVGGTVKNFDRLAISDSGNMIAAASSSASWVKLYVLGERGGIVSSSECVASVATTTDLQYVRALQFSADGQKLFALCNTSKSVIVFNVSQGTLTYERTVQLSTAPSISAQDMKRLKNGDLVVTASESSQIFILRDEGSGLSLKQTLDRPGVGTILYRPSSIVVSEIGDAFYVLNDSAKIICFERQGTDPFLATNSCAIPPAIGSAKVLSLGGIDPIDGKEFLFSAGGLSAGFYTMEANRSLGSASSLAPHPTFTDGIATGDSACMVGSAIILGGGTAGIVSVFGKY